MIRTPEFELFIAPARHYPEIWRFIVGCITGLVVYIVPIVIGFMLIAVLRPNAIWEVEMALSAPDTPQTMLILLATFIFMGLGAIAAAFWHRRGLASLIGPFRLACRNFSRAVLGCAVIFIAAGSIVTLFVPDQPTPNLDLATWLGYLPLALPLLLIQTGSEELIFRGYLMQQLAARFKSAIVWMLLPALLFGAAHYDPTLDPKLALLLISATGLFGLVAADLTRITGNLGAAIGFHFLNNFFALFLVSIAGEMSGLSLYHAPFTMDDVEMLMPLIVVDMVTIVITWAILRRWLAPS